MVRGILPPFGYQPDQEDTVRVFNRSGITATVGMVFELNLSQAGSETTENTVGVSGTSGWGSVIEVANVRCGVMCVVTDLLGNAGADNAELEVAFRGIHDVNLLAGNGHIGEGFAVTSSLQTLTVSAGVLDSKIVALALEDPGADTLVKTSCWFDGINGFGNDTVT